MRRAAQCVAIKYIQETESELNVKFPTEFKNRMIKSNGGELVTDEFEFERDQEICTFKPTLNQNSQRMGKESIVMSKVKS